MEDRFNNNLFLRLTFSNNSFNNNSTQSLWVSNLIKVKTLIFLSPKPMTSQLWVQEWWDPKVFRQQVNLSLRLIWNLLERTTVEQSLVQVKQELPWEAANLLTLLLLKKKRRGNPVPSPIFHIRTRNLSLSMKATNRHSSNNLAWAGKNPLLKICN